MDDLEEWEKRWEGAEPEPTPSVESKNTGLMIFSVLLIGAGVLLILHAEEMAPVYAMQSGLAQIFGGYEDNPYNNLRIFGIITSLIGIIMFYKNSA